MDAATAAGIDIDFSIETNHYYLSIFFNWPCDEAAAAQAELGRAELSWAEQSGAERVVGACQEIAPQYRTELDFVCDSMPRYDLRSRCRSQSFTCFSFLCKTNYRSHFKRCSFICMQFVAQWVCECVCVTVGRFYAQTINVSYVKRKNLIDLELYWEVTALCYVLCNCWEYL